MNWTEFFFGWLIKEQYRVTMLDSYIFLAEITIILTIGYSIFYWWINRK